MKAVLRENDPEGRTRPAMPNPRQTRRIVRDRQPDRPGRMWFKPYYGIEAKWVGRDRGLCASAPIWRRNAETLTKMAALSAGSNGVTLSRKERLPNWNCRESDRRATRVLYEGDQGFRDVFEEGSFTGKAGQMGL